MSITPGPYLQALIDEATLQSGNYYTELTLTCDYYNDVEGQSLRLRTYTYRNGITASMNSWVHSADGKGDTTYHGHLATMEAAFEKLKDVLEGFELDLESVKAKGTNCKTTGAALTLIARNGLAELLGKETFDADGLKAYKKELNKTQKTARAELVEKIREGNSAGTFNDMTPLERNRIGNYRKVDLSDLTLDGLCIANLDFAGASFANSSLAGAIMFAADLRKADFSGAKLDKVAAESGKFNECDLSGASLVKADLRHASLKNAKLCKADLSGAKLASADLCGADLTGAKVAKADFRAAKYDNDTVLPKGFVPPEDMDWRGTGAAPRAELRRQKRKPSGPLNLEEFMKLLESRVDKSRLSKALKMLKADRFKLYTQVDDDQLLGVVKSQTDSSLVYSCRLSDQGEFSCCTQNLNPCGGLRGKLCKHLLVLVVGLTQGGEIDPTTINEWVDNSRDCKPELDKDQMGEVLLRYKGAEAGEVDWRPTETVPEDYYIF